MATHTTPLMPAEEMQVHMRKLPGWKLNKSHIARKYTCSGFPACIDFVDAVAKRAMAVDHHPDIDIRYDSAMFRLSTHDAGGVTEKDFQLAADIDRLHQSDFANHAAQTTG